MLLLRMSPMLMVNLYNLKNDPGETKNLYFKEENIRKELNTILDQLVSSGRSAPRRD